MLSTTSGLRGLDRRFWIPNAVFLLDGAAYFGILNLLTLHLGSTLGLGDVVAGQLVSFMTGALTLFMVVFGPTVDRVGVRRTMTWMIAASFVGRALLVVTPPGPLAVPLAVVALGLMALGAGLLQTAVYAAVKQATDAETSGVGFSLIYSLMNLGIVLESLLSSAVRERFDTTGVFAACAALTLVYGLVHELGFPRDAGGPVPPAPKPDDALHGLGALAMASGSTCADLVSLAPSKRCSNVWGRPWAACGLDVHQGAVEPASGIDGGDHRRWALRLPPQSMARTRRAPYKGRPWIFARSSNAASASMTTAPASARSSRMSQRGATPSS